ncbi:MAG TPA: sigma 54-interacting transcriptional regulator [Polyangiaceae bacterium]|nr:sigma 54-interacting transcriptional regulator [Polyangiaceae bacterium]
MAEDRYQSVQGILRDVDECERRLSAGDDGSFALARDEATPRLTLPQRVVGRTEEQQRLMLALEQAAAGVPRFVFLSGAAGVGKTTLANQLEAPTLARGGCFVSGKFDVLARSQPYSALADGLSRWFARLASEDGERCDAIARTLADTLGENAATLAALVPGLGVSRGDGAAPPRLGPIEAQNRLALSVERLLAALARVGSPLVILLDDLQWADLATLRLIGNVFANAEPLPILWVGAFRDNEVPVEHPVLRLRRELQRREGAIVDLNVGPLSSEAVGELLREALHTKSSELDGLARLVLSKTLGNPFFVLQFVRSLERDGLLSFDRARGAWAFDPVRIEALEMTDNVVELMTQKLGYLGPLTQRATQCAACIGATFSLDTLAEVLGRDQRSAAQDLWEALLEGLVLPLHPNYELLLVSDTIEQEHIELRFLHDRVQQAAYDSLAEGARAELHLLIGRSLARRADAATRLFEIVGQLNRARSSMTQASEREQLAALNLEAGQRARAAAAIPVALSLFLVGLELCGDRSSKTFHELTLGAAECEFITADAATAEERLDWLLASAAPLELRVEALRVRIVRYENVGRFAESVAVGVRALELLGVRLPAEPEGRSAALEDELAEISKRLSSRGIASLFELPIAVDPHAHLVSGIIMAMWPSAFLTNPGGLTALLSASLVRRSLEHGNTAESALGYVTHAITTNARTGDYASGRAFAELGLRLSAGRGHKPLALKVEHLYGSFLSSLYEPLARGAEHAEVAHRAALECGDFTYAARAAFMGTWYDFFGGVPLDVFDTRVGTALDFMRRVRHEMIEHATSLLLQCSRCLQGLTRGTTSLSDSAFDEPRIAEQLQKVPIFTGFLETVRAFLQYAFGDFAAAEQHATNARAALAGSAETLFHFELEFYSALTQAALATPESYAQRVAAVDAVLTRLERRAATCNKNFGYQLELLLAERARILSEPDRAHRHYARALELTSAEDLCAQASCRERFAEFLLQIGDAVAARRELSAALGAYEKWGAHAKVRQLRERHAPRLTDEPAAPLTDFDVLSTLKAAQAIAAEIERNRLLPRLLRILIENAGAERGVLLEPSAEGLVIVAEQRVGEPHSDSSVERIASSEEVPLELLEGVARTAEPLLARNASEDPALRDDPYVRRRASRSLLCLPLVSQGSVRALAFLENSLASEVFSDERLSAARVLAGQAAISLENARLYEAMRKEVERRSAAERALTTALRDVDALKNRLQAENVYLQEELQSHHNFEEIVGKAPDLLVALKLVESVANTDSTVLVLGETGTGKELFARAIHSRSARRERPLVKVNCGAIASGLVESELFGHVKGAFTGALAKRVGRFELADGGTIFLDEVGELPLDTQAKLLRVLQEREFEAVGSSTTQRVDVRVIAATNRDLEQAVRAGRFRADLLYRLNVFPIVVPPLRRRAEDIPLLVSFFLTRLAGRLGKKLEGFSRAEMQLLRDYPWPGNVRELENVVERAAILAPGPLLSLDAHFGRERGTAPEVRPDLRAGLRVADPAAPANIPRSGVRSMDEVERQHVLQVLESASWVIEGERGAAKLLGLHPNTLRSRMKKLGISRRAHSGSSG